MPDKIAENIKPTEDGTAAPDLSVLNDYDDNADKTDKDSVTHELSYIQTKDFNKDSRSKIKSLIKIYALIFFSSVIRSLALQIFVLPYDFAPGGVTGIAAMLEFVTKQSSGIFLLALNLPLIVVSGFMLSRKFAIRTAVAAVLTSGILLIFSALEEKGYSIKDIEFFKTDNAMIAALAAGVLCGISLAIVLKSGASTGGTDIIASIAHKKRPDFDIGWFIFILDAIVAVSSIFVYARGINPVLLAFIMMFTTSTVCDTILSGFKSALKYEIITNEPHAVAEEIMTRLQKGVTMLPAKGMYSNEERFLLVVVIRKRNVPAMQKIIKKYPDTFCFITNTSDVIGLGFSSRG